MIRFIKCLLMAFAFLLSPLFGRKAQANTINAASCNTSDVQTAINSAQAGDTVVVPPGSCSWAGLTVAKAVSLNGAGIGLTNITLTGNNTFTKSSAGVMRIKGFSFSVTGGGDANKPMQVGGSWQSAQPIVFQNNAFTVNGSGLFRINIPGGVIFSHNTFNGQWDDSFLQLKDASDSQGSWTTADTIGTRDTNGLLNIYIEDNTFVGGSNQGIDSDDASRTVVRHNKFTNSEFNSHGWDSSLFGLRHFEVYNNQFLNTQDSSQTANVNQSVWIRGATGVIYNNSFDALAGSFWGDKPEIRLNIRGAEDDRPQGTCAQVSYPVPHQLGQNFNGTSAFTDPIYIWGNTSTIGTVDGGGFQVEANAAWNDFGGGANPCGFDWNTFFKWGRDAVNTTIGSITLSSSGGSVEGIGGTAKPGYTAYAYPHPLTASAGTAPPTKLAAVVQ